MNAAIDLALRDALAGLWGGASDLRIPGVVPLEAVQAAEQSPPPASAPRDAAPPPVPQEAAPPHSLARRTSISHWAAQADRIEGALTEGAEERSCPYGGLSLILPDGREFWTSGRDMQEIAARNLLPPILLSSWGRRDVAASSALVEFYAAPADPRAYHSGCADALRDGLLAGYRKHSRCGAAAGKAE